MTPRQVALHWRDAAVNAGFAELRALQVRTVDWDGFTGRTFAATAEDATEILLAPDLDELDDDIVEGIVVHELGHALDYAYPAQWERAPRGVEFLLVPKRTSAWERRSHTEVERMADLIGEAVFGVRIGYRGCLTLQSTRTGIRPRPAGLH